MRWDWTMQTVCPASLGRFVAAIGLRFARMRRCLSGLDGGHGRGGFFGRGRIGAAALALHAPELRIAAVLGEELLVRAALDDAAVLEHQDLIGVDDRRK